MSCLRYCLLIFSSYSIYVFYTNLYINTLAISHRMGRTADACMYKWKEFRGRAGSGGGGMGVGGGGMGVGGGGMGVGGGGMGGLWW
jgi:hypothetical protein